MEIVYVRRNSQVLDVLLGGGRPAELADGWSMERGEKELGPLGLWPEQENEN